MAKVIYWESPIDPNKKIEYLTKQDSLLNVLHELGIEREPLSVMINGENPDEYQLSHPIFETDEIVITRIVQGSSSGSKQGWATAISIIALIASVVLTAGYGLVWWSAGVSLIGGIASGALRYRAAKLALRNTGQSQSEIDVDTNGFSLTASSNETRPLQPVPLPMGSVRFAPDFANQPYPSFFGGSINYSASRNVIDVFTNSPENPALWPQVIPVGYISASPYNWPAYALSLDPRYTLADITSFTTAMKRDFAPQFFVGPFGSPSMPVQVYHSDPLDPYFGRVSSFAALFLQGTQAANQPLAIQQYAIWFDYIAYTGVFPVPTWFGSTMTTIISGDHFRWQLSNTYIRPFPVNVITAINEYITLELNQGSTPPVTDTGFVRYETTIIDSVYNYSPSLSATHIFNFGCGDLTVTDRRIEKTDIDDIVQAEFVVIEKDSWEMPSTFKSGYSRNTSILEGATLNNNSDFPGPDIFIQSYDLNNYNFIYRLTPKGTLVVEIDFQGQLYFADDTGLEENSITFEIHYRKIGAIDFTEAYYVHFFNDNTHMIRKTVRINLVSLITSPTDDFEFRIRKVQLDVNNNNGKHVAQFDISSFKCFGDDYDYGYMGQEIEGVFLMANTQTSGQSNKYSAQVDSKCWVYDFDTDTWSWDYTRNPAWWFLYFARGGFKNPSADGTFVSPWSPTFGWVNGPGHPDSTEFMFGCGMYDENIDIDGLIEWGQFCEDQNLFIDIVVKDSITEAEILEKIANIGRGSVSYYKGLLSVVYEDSAQTPVGLYGMGNIIQGSFTADYSVANLPSKVIGTFANRNEDWETQQVEADIPFADPNNLNVITMTLDGITTESQAQREVNILAARQFFQKRTYSWKVDKEGLIAKRGDLVYLSHDSTQFNWSGRVLKFIVEEDTIIGIETTAEITDDTVSYITIRKPNGDLVTLECHVENCNIIFDEEFDFEDAAYYLFGNNDLINEDSLFADSFPDDYIFAAGPLETTGKIVRISQIQPDEQLNFTLTAIDEDPSMWSYEYGPVIPPESFDASTIVSRVFNVGYEQLGDGLVKLFWETDGADFIKIINVDTSMIVTANSQSSFSGNQVILELTPGAKYNLRVEPFVIGSPYQQENVSLVVWA